MTINSDCTMDTSTPLEAKVTYLLDRQNICDVFRRYTRGLNRCDIELLKSAFWSDAQINYGPRSHSRDEWVASWHEYRHQKGLACQAHHITNESVDISGDVAHVESYLIAFRRESDGESAFIIGGRYIDRFDRRNQDWRIAVREYIPHFCMQAQSTFDSLLSTWSQSPVGIGACDASDVSYRRPLRPRPPKK